MAGGHSDQASTLADAEVFSPAGGCQKMVNIQNRHKMAQKYPGIVELSLPTGQQAYRQGLYVGWKFS
jgi:hypothetical protein